jgi:DNA-binding transcriptional LysR family regulator
MECLCIKVSSVDNLSALSAFVRAAEVRSFTDAGRQMNLSSSAIGKAIARLEERHGVRLFHRSTRSITLTQEGKLFLESCRRIISEIENIKLELAQTKGVPKGKLRVGSPVIGMLMMPTFSQFISAYPKIELDIEFTDYPVDVIDGGYDIVLCAGFAADSRLMSRSLGTFRLEIVGSPAYFARTGLPSVPEDLATHACLHRKNLTTGKLERWPFAKSTLGDDFALPITVTASASEPLISLAELGLGIACVPDFAIRRQIAEGSLVRVLESYIEHSETFRAIWPCSRYPSPKLSAFVDFLAKHPFAQATPMQKSRPTIPAADMSKNRCMIQEPSLQEKSHLAQPAV